MAGAAPGTVEQVRVAASLTYVKETTPAWDAHPPYLVVEKYEYWLELDENENIIGGEHLAYNRPDFAWYLEEVSENFRDYFSPLSKIYAASIGRETNTDFSKRQFLGVSMSPKNIQTMKSNKETFGISAIPNNYYKGWSISPDRAKKIRIEFNEFSTERYRDKVKIYEGELGEGALIAVLHGNQNSTLAPIIVNHPSAFVLLTTDESGQSNGFSATYFSIMD